MPTIPIPPAIRFTLYLLSAVGSVVVSYLTARGILGDAEVALWAGLVAIVNGLAAAKTNLTDAPHVSVSAPPGAEVTTTATVPLEDDGTQ